MPLGVSTSGAEDSSRFGPLKCNDGSRPQVLLAEDSQAARVLTSALLKRIGCDVDVAEHGEDAVRLIKKSSYDLVLMDIEMPVMDGMVAAKTIRKLGGETAQTPIVALSAFLADTKKSSHWDEYFDVALAKPAGRKQLHATIKKVLNNKPLKTTGNKVNDNGQAKEAAIVNFDKLAIVESNLSPDDWKSLLEVSASEIWLAAQNIVDAAKPLPIDVIYHNSHNLCGLASSFAADQLWQRARKICDDIKADRVGDLTEEVSQLCACAGKTAGVLKRAAMRKDKLAS